VRAPAPGAARSRTSSLPGEGAAALGSGARRAGSSRPPRRSSGDTRGRSPARVTALIVGGVLIGIAALVVALLSLGGASGNKSATASTGTTASHVRKAHGKSSSAPSSSKLPAGAASAAETNVAVLNGTGTTGLAHRISGQLRQSGYSQATALNGRPPGANQVTVVEYASGHRADAQGVANALGVGQAQPMEATVSSLSGSATVVVIVGLDKAATVP